jgi:uncharacterized membrane protein YccC
MRLRATWPLPAAVILVLVGLIYARGPLIAEVISLVLILAGLVLAGWALTPRRSSSSVHSPGK